MKLTERQHTLLTRIIEAYVDDAEPVSSHFLVEQGLDWSAATIRNDMALLEHAGYIAQPHTSAGRIPTEKGWKYYLGQFHDSVVLTPEETRILKQAANQIPDAIQRTKEVAKAVAELSGQTIIVGFAPHDMYYTGITNLVRHPEFQDVDILQELTTLVDHCDDVVADMFGKLDDAPHVLIGRENPFGMAAGSIVAALPFITKGIFCLLGPIRMNYPKNIARIRAAQNALT